MMWDSPSRHFHELKPMALPTAAGNQRRGGIGRGWLGFEWSEREDLNLRPLVPQTSALTGLRYAPTEDGRLRPSLRRGQVPSRRYPMLSPGT